MFAAFTTGASDGAVNGMHGSFTPLGGGVALFLMQLGEILPGGVGSALAGSLAAKPRLAPTAGTLPTHGGLFIGLLIGVILILGGLQFFPVLALGPIVEHFQVLAAAR